MSSLTKRNPGAAGPKVRKFVKGWAAPRDYVKAHFYRREDAGLAVRSCGGVAWAGDLHEPGIRHECKVCLRVLYGRA
jgi:hypothetical protein